MSDQDNTKNININVDPNALLSPLISASLLQSAYINQLLASQNNQSLDLHEAILQVTNDWGTYSKIFREAALSHQQLSDKENQDTE